MSRSVHRSAALVQMILFAVLMSGASAFTQTPSSPKKALIPNSQRPELALQVGHTGYIKTILFTKDGRSLITDGSDGARIWDMSTREVRSIIRGSEDWRKVAASP